MFYQAFDKFQEDIGIKIVFENHKVQLTLICNGRNHIATEAGSSCFDYRFSSALAKRSSDTVIGTKAHFITPVF